MSSTIRVSGWPVNRSDYFYRTRDVVHYRLPSWNIKLKQKGGMGNWTLSIVKDD